MPELSADPKNSVVQSPMSRFNRTVPYTYAGYSFSSDPDLPEVTGGEEDQFYTVSFADMFRPDLVSSKVYNDPNLWWFIVLVNESILKADGKLNFLEMFLPGVTLRIPPQQVAYSYINGN